MSATVTVTWDHEHPNPADVVLPHNPRISRCRNGIGLNTETGDDDMTQQTQDANAILMGGGGAPTASFADPGTTWEGTIVSPPQAFHTRKWVPDGGIGDLAYFPSGDPIMGVTIDIQTDVRDPLVEEDDGIRRIYLDGRYNKPAVAEAVRKTGAKGLEVGGRLKITFTHREDPDDKRSRKFWAVEYTPAGNAALMSENGDKPAGAVTSMGATPDQTARALIAYGLDDAAILKAAPGLSPNRLAQLRDAPPF